MRAIRAALEPGHRIVAEGELFDALVVNGEGTMHDGSGGFHQKMQAIAAAQAAGRKTFLVNTLWHDNPCDYDDALRALDGIVVRDELSRRELAAKHRVDAEVRLDFSYFAPHRAEPPPPGPRKGIRATDFYSREFGCFVRVRGGRCARFEFLDMKTLSWDELITELGRTAILVTGRHHAVYAACVARTPFVALSGNAPKIEGLIATSPVEIPVAQSFAEIDGLIEWARGHRDIYRELFDWMAAQPRWEGIPV